MLDDADQVAALIAVVSRRRTPSVQVAGLGTVTLRAKRSGKIW